MTTTDISKSLPLPPGDFGLPLIGETVDFLRDRDFADKRHQKYGPIFKTNLFGKPTVMAIGAEANRFILTHENQYFSVTLPHSAKVLLGSESLTLQVGTVHQKRRKLLSQAFQPRALAGYVTGMEEIIQGYLAKWQSLGILTWYPELRDLTFDIACKLLVGIDGASQSPISKWFKDFSEGLFTIPISFPWTKFGRALHCREKLLTEIEKIVRERQEGEDSSQDALGLLLQARDEEGNSLSLQELKEQVLLLLFAGHETLTSAIASTCLLLAQHPPIVAAIRAEQEELGLAPLLKSLEGEAFGQKTLDFSDNLSPEYFAPTPDFRLDKHALDNSLTMEQLKLMTYLEQVLKEVLRLIPPVAAGFRDIIQSCEFNGYQLPQGWSILYRIRQTHYDPNIYFNPEEFDPARFAPERGEDKAKPFGYLPFGGGIRECLGREFAKLEMKLFTTLLVRDYQWELLPGQSLDMITIPTPHPRDELRVKFWRRGE